MQNRNKYWPLALIALLLGLSVFAYQKYGYLLQSARNFPPRTEITNTSPLQLPTRNTEPVESDPELSFISLPPGFAIQYFASDVPGARSLTRGDNGVVYVGTRPQGVVYALEDQDQDGRADTRFIVASGLNNPNGVAYQDGALYVAEIARIIKFDNVDNNYSNNPPFHEVFTDLPEETHHGWRYISFGPDSKLYIGIGAPCNICENSDPFATISRLNSDGTDFEVVGRGIRNTVGFDWNPADSSLWFTDNGRDNLGDNSPPDELNRVGDLTDFGFPYCHGGHILDPSLGRDKDCADYDPPAQNLGPHVAALGMKFYRGSMFPPEYQNKIFIAEHGSWNRSIPIGYRVTTVDISGTYASKYQTFASGWLDPSGSAQGRPVDILEMDDGSLLISDDKAGAVYRVVYNGM